MKHIQKVLALILAMAMTMALCACGGSTGAQETTAAPAATQAATQAAASEAASAESETAWPERAVNIIVGANPGGGQDLAARTYTKYLTEALGVTFNVVNVSGASGSIASTQVKDATADGYTMLCMHEALLSNKLTGLVDYNYDGFKLAGIAMFSKNMTVYANADKYKSMDDVIEAAKANPGSVIAATEWGGTTHQMFLAIEQGCGIDMNIVDAGSVGDRITGVIGGHYDLTICPAGNAADYVAAGSLVPVMVFNADVIDAYKDIPISSDYNVDYVCDKFFALYFPAGTDDAIVSKCHDALEAISQDPNFIADVEGQQLIVGFEDTTDFLEGIARNLAVYAEKYTIE